MKSSKPNMNLLSQYAWLVQVRGLVLPNSPVAVPTASANLAILLFFNSQNTLVLRSSLRLILSICHHDLHAAPPDHSIPIARHAA